MINKAREIALKALYKIENLFRSNKIEKQYRRSRYHAMMLFRMVVSKEEMPRFNQKRWKAIARNFWKFCRMI